ncbi:MAG: hypothetical protein UR22_C0013G0007 [Parcubacteria group bacterium GW2011_GWC2_32_10]|nr:MAG: hypothetical protein UR22_C0013G0007 [Parcubacteria group bacterium GW2011_GWC2_32_10]
MVTRVEWNEPGTANQEPRFVIAERIGENWQFSEKGSSEVRWLPAEATSERICRANEKSRRGYHCQHR